MEKARIKALSDDCINKIAAGEVIERPASVIKELIENSIDANANDISVLIKEGGKTYIKVSDNGSGIDALDIDICFDKHTTSKIKSAEDIFDIDTTGFRGEALSSIAAVAKVTMRTKTNDADNGTEVKINDGKIISKSEIALNHGCTFIVEDLFHSIPARKNFLSSAQGETTRITQIFTRLALAHPQIRFNLKQGNKELFNSNAGSLFNRINDVFGSKLSAAMLPIEHEDTYLKIHGVIAPPEQCKGRRTQQYFFLNKRPIFNPMLSKALSQAYESLNPGKYPPAVLYIELKNGEFDLNVHPTKKEVRFKQESMVFTSVVRSIKETLSVSMQNQFFKIDPEINTNCKMPHEVSGDMPSLTIPSESANYTSTNSKCTSLASFEQFKIPTKNTHTNEIADIDKTDDFKSNDSQLAEAQDLFDTAPNIISLKPDYYRKEAHKRQKEAPIKPLDIKFYQLARRYIVTEDNENLIIINQVAAHQRVLYEEAMRSLENSTIKLNSQQLLFPIDMEFTPAEYSILETAVENLKKLAYNLEPFGVNCFKLRGIPLDLSVSQAEESIRTILSNIEAQDDIDENYKKNLAKAYAKGAAISKNEELNQEKMNFIVQKLFLSKNPLLSPFGKPTLMKHDFEDLEKKFNSKNLSKY